MFGDKKDKKVVLTKEQAIIALIEGNRLSHSRLLYSQEVELKNGKIMVSCAHYQDTGISFSQFLKTYSHPVFETDWEII